MSKQVQEQSIEERLSGIEYLLQALVSQKTEANRLTSKPLTIKQAADFVCKAVPTVYGMVSKRQIPHYKRGKRLYFNITELSEWLEAGRRQTTKEMLDEDVDAMTMKFTSKHGKRHE